MTARSRRTRSTGRPRRAPGARVRSVLSEGPLAVHVRMGDRTVQIARATKAAPLVPHRFPGPPVEAMLVERPNRFLAVCRLRGVGETVRAHVPDRGRCLDLLIPGRPLVLVQAQGPAGPIPRSTGYTAVLARARTAPSPGRCLDPAGAPRLVEAALERGLLASLRGYRVCGR